MESDRPHCFELILADKSVLQMCAASGEEAQEWLLALCQAVAESSQVGKSLLTEVLTCEI